jgi:hypothetical protein
MKKFHVLHHSLHTQLLNSDYSHLLPAPLHVILASDSLVSR